MNKRKVTVFGGANPKPDQPAYMEAFDLGKALGRAGYTILTGGYMGTMEAVSRGAAEAGAHVIGVTCRQIETWRNARRNPWVIEEIQCETLAERITTLIHSCDAAIALAGGAGTLAEISLMWNEMIIQALDVKPLILFGKAWEDVFLTYYDRLGDYNPPANRRLISFTHSIDEIMVSLQKSFQLRT